MKPPSLWRLASASAIGTSHLLSGLPCQDSQAIQALDSVDGPVLVVVVCDGAGSAAYSDVGSAMAVSTFIGLVDVYMAKGNRLRELTRDIVVSWIEAVAQALETHAEGNGHAVRDYACTLLAAIVGQDEAAFVQIGDGAIVVSHGEADGWSYVFWPQHGEFANTTNFVVSLNALDVVEFDFAPRCIQEFALFSDGIEKLVLHDETRTVHQTFFNSMFIPVRKAPSEGVDEVLSKGLHDYLASPVICDRTDDDKTLVLATRLSPSVEGLSR
ncbi:PP2C family serine/threonine-protein phosphatase [Burkholderia sp. L27(2015)]|uniref:PP2C family serine/threonine-protein phosphatase n=1 Tax=Burkholderia sp. L27(2015) TaxID=1641858 RepID=UPI00131D0BE4|nr:PP2C family serine/threonine-protein phosphatase [Burkholderia sp. L27(2015)]